MAKKTSATVQFKKPGLEPEDVEVAHGDGLAYVGHVDRVKCPHFRSRGAFSRDGRPDNDTKTKTASHVLIGPPPEGVSDEDLLDAGIGTCISVDQVAKVSTSGQWQHVPASDMAGMLSDATAARDLRVKEHADLEAKKAEDLAAKKAKPPKP